MSAKSLKCKNFAKCKTKIYADNASGLCRPCFDAQQRASVTVRTCSKCPHIIGRENQTGLCAACLREQQRQDALDHAARLAADRPTDADVLRRDNADLNARLGQAKTVITEYQKRATLEDRLFKEVQEFIERNPYRPVLKAYKAPKTAGKATEHEMLAVVSDAHYPEVVDPQQTFGLRYDANVCKHRLEYLRDKIVRYGDLRQTAYPVRKLIVNVNGDMISGDIHEELEVTNQVPITESMVQMSYMLLDFGMAMREHFGEVEFIVMPGNHPRLHKKPRFKQKWNNWEWVMGMFLQALAGKSFNVVVPKDLVYQFNIFGKRVGVTHGDGQKVQSYAGIPWYGMEKRRTKLQALLKQLDTKQLDLLVYGHFHQLIFEEGQGCSLFINGSIKGGDEYTTGAMYAAQSPVQGLLTFHPRHGITDVSRINLGHIQE